MTRLIAAFSILAASTALASCGSKPAGTGNASTPAPANAAAPANTAAPANSAATAGNAASATPTRAHPNLTVANRSTTPIIHFYIGPTSSDEWGDDLFTAGDPLAAGASTEIEFDHSDTECVWDIKVVVQGGASHELRNINLCTTHEVTYSE